MADDGWMTTTEAAAFLGYTASWVARVLRREGIEEIRKRGGNDRSPNMWDRAQVERLFRKRQPAKEHKARGEKQCLECREWKDKATQFHQHCSMCKACRPAYDRKRKRKYGKTFANTNPDLSDCPDDWRAGEPPKPGDSDKYECMTGFFQHKPRPPEGRRKAFCRKCKAPRCVHHPNVTPKEMRKLKRVPSRYPAFDLRDYADG